MLFGKTSACIASRFVGEIPESCTEKTGVKSYSSYRESDSYGYDREERYGGSSYSRSREDSRRYEGYEGPSRPDYYGARPEPRQSSTYASPSGRRRPITKPVTPPPVTKTQGKTFSAGDSVKHKAFGNGIVISVTNMGSDAMLEVNFEGAGKKRLMRNSAAAFMEKI